MVSKKYGSIFCMVGLLVIFSWVSGQMTMGFSAAAAMTSFLSTHIIPMRDS